MRIRIKIKRVALDHFEPARIARRDFAKRRYGALVAFDGDDPASATREQGPRQPAGTRADFDYGHALKRLGGPSDARRQIEIKQKILAERFFCDEIMAPDNLA